MFSKLITNMRVGRKLMLGFGAIIGLLGFAIVASLITSGRYQRAVTDLIGQSDGAAHGANARGAARALRHYEKEIFLNLQNPEKLGSAEESWNHWRQTFLGELRVLDDAATSGDDKAMVAALRQAHDAYEATIRDIVSRVRAGSLKDPVLANAAVAPVEEQARSLDVIADKLAHKYQELVEENGAAAITRAERGNVFVITVAIIALVLAVVIAALLGVVITRPLRRAVAGAKEVALGRFQITAPEELGQMTQAFEGVRGLLVESRGELQKEHDDLQHNVMDLLRVVGEASEGDLTVRAPVWTGALGNVSDAFNTLLEELGGLIGQVRTQINRTESAVGTIRDSSERVKVGATSQATEVVAATRLVERMSNEIGRASESAEHAAQAARRTEASAVEGSRAVQDVISGMTTLRANVQAGAKKMKNLGDRSMEITSIVQTISRISEQTNMLALNAAIEAARAGEHGRGFSVVAEEVRKLAERTAVATQDIDKLVKTIHAETNETVIAIEQQTHVVEQESEVVGRAGESLKKIHKDSSESSVIVIDISNLAREQAKETSSMVKVMERVLSIAQETQAGVAGTVATVQQLSRLSTELAHTVDRFKVA